MSSGSVPGRPDRRRGTSSRGRAGRAGDRYRTALRSLDAARWTPYLLEHSGLPGPRANLELMHAVAEEGDQACFDRLIATDDEYLVCCGVVGLGRLLAERADVEARLRTHATDGRWRVREAVAMALQRVGDADTARLLDIVGSWADDPDPLVRRAAVAGICEPRLLTSAGVATRAVDVCAGITDGLAALPSADRRTAQVRTLRQALGYCWSVAVAADPVAGLPRFRALAASADPDVAWIVRENSRKARLAKLL
jgi:hypothetical protein